MIIHIVNKEEVLWRIADYYGVNINDIIKINGLLNPNLLLEGQSLLIPSPGILYVYPNLIYPGVKLTIPQEPKPPIEVNALTYVFGEVDVEILGNIIEYLTYLTPFAYIVREDGRLSQINDDQAIQLAIANNVVPVMSVANYSFNNAGTDIAHAVLNNMELMNELLDNIIYTLKEKGYRGIKFDFENILPEDREAYNNFLQMARGRLHMEGYFISSALAPKHSDELRGLFYEAHDYEAHGRLVDYIVLMFYKWGFIDGPPRPIAPINDIRRVLEYATTVIPRDKIFVGLPLYAKDWAIPYVEGQQAEIISIQEAMNRAYKNKVKINYDESSQSPFYNYMDEQGLEHEVWFEDPRSLKEKFNLIKEFGIRGISYWNLGYEFNQNWHLLEDNFVIVKD